MLQHFVKYVNVNFISVWDAVSALRLFLQPIARPPFGVLAQVPGTAADFQGDGKEASEGEENNEGRNEFKPGHEKILSEGEAMPKLKTSGKIHATLTGYDFLEDKPLSPRKAMRKKCLECAGGSA